MEQLRRTDRLRMRAMNTKLVIDAVRSFGSTSQADLIGATRLSTGTIVSIVAELKRQGYLVETGQETSRGGRPRTLLELDSSTRAVLCARVGSDTATVAIAGLDARIMSREEITITRERGPKVLMKALVGSFNRQLRGRGAAVRALGLGLSLHGPVDSRRGIMLLSEHLGWKQVPFGDELGKALAVPVRVEDETGAIAVAEQRWGAARGARDFVLIELDTGIGMTQVLSGAIVQGAHNLAGELGFTVWDSGAKKLRTLESVASLRSFVPRAVELVRNLDASDPEGIVREILDASISGNAKARRLVDETVRTIGIAVTNVINILDPELVLLTGRLVSPADKRMLGMIRGFVLSHVLGAAEREVRIEQATAGPDAALLGAAALVIDDHFGVDRIAEMIGP